MKSSFTEVWQRIVKLQGDEFHTKKGLPFTYSVRGQVLTTSRTNYNLPMSQFEKAYNMMPVESMTHLSSVVRGPAYIYAILNDPRINP
jgi:hypothetical protein